MTVPVFPALPGITMPRKRSPRWSTVKQDAISGKRTRFALWTYPIYDYELTFSYLRSDQANLEWQSLAGFFNAMQGPARLFAYADPDDGAVTAQDLGQGDGVTTSFQLVRALGGFTEPVFLVNGAPVITVAGVVVAPATISSYGIVTFATPPAAGALLAWSGRFYWPCYFEEDTIDFEKILYNIFELKSLKFSTSKLP